MKSIFHKIKQLESYTIHHVIIVFTAFFSLVFFVELYDIHNRVKKITEQNRALNLKDIEYAISSWIDKRVYEIENSAKFIVANKTYLSRKKIKNIHNLIIEDNNFDAIQILIEDDIFYFNGLTMIDYHNGYRDKHALRDIDPLQTEWYTRTKKTLSTTLGYMNKHGYLKEQTINLCTPLQENGKFYGVMCGIIMADSLFKKIKKLKIPSEIFYFIKNKSGDMVIGLQDKNIERLILNYFKNYQEKDCCKMTETVEIGNTILTIKEMEDLHWHVGVGVKKDYILNTWLQYVVQNFIFLVIFFILFLIVINGAYKFLYRRVEEKKIEYEKILQYRSRLNEVGELISGINHQLKQPLNALSLTVSNTLNMSKSGLLSKQDLEENMVLSKKSIKLMDDTINIFRNFYRCNEEMSEFYLKDCIDGVLHVTRIDFIKKNIIIDFQREAIKNIKIKSIENYIQQILLVLLLNAKDAIVEKNSSIKTISIEVSMGENRVNIDVLDFGIGVSDDAKKSIFSKIKHSKKKQGFGIGLVFAKKMANEKLDGDLMLINQKNPTIFRFSFKNSQ